MALSDLNSIILLSIHPRYAEAIISGTKKVEFRKASFSKYISGALVYATSPIQRVIGYFEISYIEQGDPTRLWKKHRSYGSICYEDFKEYYANTKKPGIAIGITNPVRFNRPFTLSDLCENLKPPQSYIYLPSRAVNYLNKTKLH